MSGTKTFAVENAVASTIGFCATAILIADCYPGLNAKCISLLLVSIFPCCAVRHRTNMCYQDVQGYQPSNSAKNPTMLRCAMLLICFLAFLQVDAAENQAAEQKQQADQQAKDSEGQAEGDQPATLKKAQTAAAARKDGEEVGSSGQASLWLFVQRFMCAQAFGFVCCFPDCLCLNL